MNFCSDLLQSAFYIFFYKEYIKYNFKLGKQKQLQMYQIKLKIIVANQINVLIILKYQKYKQSIINISKQHSQAIQSSLIIFKYLLQQLQKPIFKSQLMQPKFRSTTPNNQTKTFKTQHTFTSNDDMGYIYEQNFQDRQDHQNRQNLQNRSNRQGLQDRSVNNNTRRPLVINYDQQFDQIYQQIISHQYFQKISKHDKIRINKWLTKLDNIRVNDLWKKNRNNYIKLIRLMFDCEIIIAPFLMMPPDRDLHKLTNHEINVIINQVERLVDQKDTKCQQNKNILSTNRQRLTTKVLWTQQSAYIDHQNRSQQKYNKQKDYNYQNDYKRTYQTSSVTIKNNKAHESNIISNCRIPPKYPTTTKNASLSKEGSSHNFKSNNNLLMKQCYFIKQTPNLTLNNDNGSSSPTKKNDLKKNAKAQYFTKKQRCNTFQTQDNNIFNQQQYLIQMKNSSLQRNQSIYEKQHYKIHEEQRELELESVSKQAINILKCGLKLLQKLPREHLQSSHSSREIQSLSRIMIENEYLKNQMQKQNLFLQQFIKSNQDKALTETNNLNRTQKNKFNEKKKMKLTLLSQPTNRV